MVNSCATMLLVSHEISLSLRVVQPRCLAASRKIEGVALCKKLTNANIAVFRFNEKLAND